MITKTGDKPTLADIDGTVPGRAVLMSARTDSDNSEPMAETRDEQPGDTYDPWTTLEGLQRSIEADFPDRGWAIVGNWRARYLRWAHTMQFIIPGDHTPQDYLETFE